jgi:hypothetical protein
MRSRRLLGESNSPFLLERTYMQTCLFELHQNCPLSIRWKLFRNKKSPTPGLFCSCHDTFLDWLPDHIAYELIDVDRIPVEMYTERKKKKRAKPSDSKVLKIGRTKKKKIKKAQNAYKLKYGREMPLV